MQMSTEPNIFYQNPECQCGSVVRYATCAVNKKLVSCFYFTVVVISGFIHPVVVFVTMIFSDIGISEIFADLDKESIHIGFFLLQSN